MRVVTTFLECLSHSRRQRAPLSATNDVTDGNGEARTILTTTRQTQVAVAVTG